MASPHPRHADPEDLGKRVLTRKQASRLAALSGAKEDALAGKTIAQASEQLRWTVDPIWFWFVRICGQVVKTDPATGIAYPVPFATVIVEDRDCDLLGYFPPHGRWGWYFPLRCHTEVLATVMADACGHFCVWVPRFDIDWILRWRHERICFPIIFERPNLGDLVEIPFPPQPIPGPDPAPDLAQSLDVIELRAGASALAAAKTIASRSSGLTLGHRAASSAGLGALRAFPHEVPPPLPADIKRALAGHAVAAHGTDHRAAVTHTIANHLGVAAETLDHVDFNAAIGPFRRCIDIEVPVWQLIFEVPDYSFRVTQDISGNGVQQTIYDGHFDISLGSGTISGVVLEAAPIARESRICTTPDVPCGTVPEIKFAGLMPLENPAYFDEGTGYALRPNRPKTPPAPRPAAETPFCEDVQLYGCVNIAGAAYYRVSISADGGAHYNPVTGLAWNIYAWATGIPTVVSADSHGWYAIIANPDDYHPARLVLDWPTPALGDYLLKIELADGAKTLLPAASSPIAIQVDNTAPTVQFTTLAWKFASESDSAFSDPSRNLLVPCPTIHRHDPPQDIVVRAEVFVTANHLRDVTLVTSGCGGGSFAVQASPAPVLDHWYQSEFDNTVTLHADYALSHAALEGSYSVGCVANSRAMNPSGADGGNLVPPDWFEDVVYIYVTPEIDIAVVNA